MTSARMNPFVEADCEIGGSACGSWCDWWEAVRERAERTPEGLAVATAHAGGEVDDDGAAEAIDAIAGAMGDAGTEAIALSPCTRPSCRRHAEP